MMGMDIDVCFDTLSGKEIEVRWNEGKHCGDLMVGNTAISAVRLDPYRPLNMST